MSTERRLVLVLVLVARAAFAATDEAGTLYEEGARLYQVEKWDHAIEAFKSAYVLSANPGLLYNIAQAYRLWGEGHCRDALKYYRQYLELKPKAQDRAAVELLIAKMKECAEHEPTPPVVAPAPAVVEPAPAPPAAVTVTAEPAPAPSRQWPAVATAALGAVTLAVGVGFDVRAHSAFGELQAQCPCPRETWQGWKNMETASAVLMGLGSVALLGGALWWLLGKVL